MRHLPGKDWVLGLVDGSVRRQVKDDIATAQNLCFFFWDWNVEDSLSREARSEARDRMRQEEASRILELKAVAASLNEDRRIIPRATEAQSSLSNLPVNIQAAEDFVSCFARPREVSLLAQGASIPHLSCL